MDISKISHANRSKFGWGTLTGMIVALAIAAPSLAQSAISLDPLGRNFRPDPLIVEGNGGGNVSLASIAAIAGNCRGFANVKPNHTLVLAENFPLMDLLVYTDNINDDPTMLIKGSDGTVICADDESGGRYPQAYGRLAKGTYQIWIGSKTINQSFPYKLSLSEIRQK